MAKTKGSTKGMGKGDKVTTGTKAPVLVPSKRAQVLAFIAYAKANDIPVGLLPGIMYAYSTVMARRHGASGQTIKNALGECSRYPANALKGRHSCIGDDFKVAMVWVRGLKITKALATTAQGEYAKARVANKAQLAKANTEGETK